MIDTAREFKFFSDPKAAMFSKKTVHKVFRSIHDKLVRHTLSLLLSSTLFFCITVLLMLSTILYFYYKESIQRINEVFESKGNLLLSTSIYSFSEYKNDVRLIKETIGRAVLEDPSIAYGIYMDTNMIPLELIVSDSYLNMYSENETVLLTDSLSRWASIVLDKQHKDFVYNDLPYIEFAAPIMIVDSLNNRIRTGTIRYGFSLAQKYIELKRIEAQFHKSLILALISLLIITLIIFLFGMLSARHQASVITYPLRELIVAAETITNGNYDTIVKKTSNDEVGILADNFEMMRKKIKQSTENLETLVSLRTKQLEGVQSELIDQAHKAGMADVAANILHNAGNILNSIMTSISMSKENCEKTKAVNLEKANELLEQHLKNVSTVIPDFDKIEELLKYCKLLAVRWKEEVGTCAEQMNTIQDRVILIEQVIKSQQNFAKLKQGCEVVDIRTIIEDTLELLDLELRKNSTVVEKLFKPVPGIKIDRVKMMHVLINLLKNARDAMVNDNAENRKIVLSTCSDENSVYVNVSDSGVGIATENIGKLFTHGFTTKASGHGFGLHSSANYIKEMNGNITVHSDGEGKGTTFTISIPAIRDNV